MVVKVYGDVTAACPQRVLACLLEKDVAFEIVPIHLASGDHKRPEFLQRQPFGQVPAIEDGDFKLFESRAIARYYAAKYAERGSDLLGKTLEEKALVDQWTEIEAHNFNDLVQPVVFNVVVKPRMGEEGDKAIVHSCKDELEKVLDVYEKRLSDSKYLAGDTFSLADLTHMPALRYLTREAGMEEMVASRKHVKVWWDDISDRPAWKRLMKIAGL